MEIAEPGMTNSWWSAFRPICIADIVGHVETDSLPVSRIDSEIYRKETNLSIFELSDFRQILSCLDFCLEFTFESLR